MTAFTKGAKRMHRGRTLAGARHRYDVVLLCTHAELHIRDRHGKGEVHAVAKIDHEDADLVRQYAWHLSWTMGEPRIETDTGKARGSRIHFSLQQVLFPTAGRRGVTFLNGDTLDFRKANLAPGQAYRRPRTGSKSGARGVSWNKHSGKWEASVGKTRLGMFATVEEAAAVAKAERTRRGWAEKEVEVAV